MIEFDVIAYLKTDGTLNTLLGAVATDSKIYPNVPKVEPAAPYIVFYHSVGMQTGEHLDGDRIQFNVFGSTMVQVSNIRNRLKFLLDRQDEIQDTVMTSADWYIYFSRLSGGDTVYEPERNQFQAVLFFELKYQKK